MKRKFICSILIPTMFLTTCVAVPNLSRVIAYASPEQSSEKPQLTITYNCEDKLGKNELIPINFNLSNGKDVKKVVLQFTYPDEVYSVMSWKNNPEMFICSAKNSIVAPGFNDDKSITITGNRPESNSSDGNFLKMTLQTLMSTNLGFDKIDFANTKLYDSAGNAIDYDIVMVNDSTGRVNQVQNAQIKDSLSSINSDMKSVDEKVDNLQEQLSKLYELVNNQMEKVNSSLGKLPTTDQLDKINSKLNELSDGIKNASSSSQVDDINGKLDDLDKKVDKITSDSKQDDSTSKDDSKEDSKKDDPTSKDDSKKDESTSKEDSKDDSKKDDSNSTETPSKDDSKDDSKSTETPSKDDSKKDDPASKDDNKTDNDNKQNINNSKNDKDGDTTLKDQNGNDVKVPNTALNNEGVSPSGSNGSNQTSTTTPTPNGNSENQSPSGNYENQSPSGTVTPDDGKGPLDDGKGPLNWESVKTGDNLMSRIIAGALIGILMFLGSVMSLFKFLTINRRLGLFKRHRVVKDE